MTSNTSDIVRGSVTFYNADKKFGFAEVMLPETGRARVFFHQSACREAEGTPEEPIFTSHHSDKAPSWWKGCRRPAEIILRVVTGSKGPMAAVWGYRPQRTWLQTLQHFKHLERYADGHIEVRWSEREHGRVEREMTARLVAVPLLKPTTGGPDDPWRLTLTYDVYDGVCERYDPPTRRQTTTIELERRGDRADTSLPYGRMGITHYDSEHREWMRITFYPKSAWFGWEPGNQYDSPYKHR